LPTGLRPFEEGAVLVKGRGEYRRESVNASAGKTTSVTWKKKMFVSDKNLILMLKKSVASTTIVQRLVDSLVS
jgi:hypothetical protein